MRQARSSPLLADLRAWFDVQFVKLFARGPSAEAIGYALNHWDGLLCFANDGCIEIDSNTVERSMRPVRQPWPRTSETRHYAPGSYEGGEHWAGVASLVETCKLKAVDPKRYFAELLDRLVNGWPQARIDELMPWCWTKTQGE